ncbi:MAG TPA: hypothetical protein VHC19_11035, partial [Pirellulales bacterium]|nr:hypothetical protein [Pirellulales bacterium]
MPDVDAQNGDRSPGRHHANLFGRDPGLPRSGDDFQLARFPRQSLRSPFPRLSAAKGGGQTR